MSDLKFVLSRCLILALLLALPFFALWFLFGLKAPETAPVFVQIIIFLCIAAAIFSASGLIGFLARVFLKVSESQEAGFREAVRQAVQTALFGLFVIILQSRGLLNGWVIVEFVILVLAFDWYWAAKKEILTI